MTAEWQTLSDRMRDEAPAFIVGVPRSGTTALRNTLGLHSSFKAKGFESPETRVFVEPESVFQVLEPAGERIFGYLLEDRAAATAMLAALSEMKRPGGGRNLLDLVRAADPVEDPVWKLSHKDDMVRVFFWFAKQARGVRRLLEKTPVHLMYLTDIFAAFPRAQIVMCVRHPVDVFSSYKKKLADESQRRPITERDNWLKTPLEKFCRLYASWIDQVLAFGDSHPDAARMLRYEDLTAEPERRLGEVCAFLGEPFEAGALLGDREAVRDQQGSPRPRHRIAENEKDWREFLSAAEAQALEDQLAGAMAELGYARFT